MSNLVRFLPCCFGLSALSPFRPAGSFVPWSCLCLVSFVSLCRRGVGLLVLAGLLVRSVARGRSGSRLVLGLSLAFPDG